MGLFSTKKKHYVSTQVQRVIEDDMINNPVQTAALRSIFDEDFKITDAIKYEALLGTHQLFNSYYRYGKDHYHYGLPDTTILSSDAGVPAANLAMTADVGQPINIDYMYFRPLNSFHVGWKVLQEDYGYSESSNKLTTEPGDVYLEKMVAVHSTLAGREPEETSLGNFGNFSGAGETPERSALAPTNNIANLIMYEEERFEGTIDKIEFHTATLDEEGVMQRSIIVYSLAAYDLGEEYYQGRYSLVTGDTDSGYWIYNPADNVHTALTNIFDPPDYTNPGTYFPIAVFRSENVDRTADTYINTQEYITTEKLLSKIGMDFKAMGDSLNEAGEIDTVPQAVLLMGVPINSTDPLEIEYMHRYFSNIYEQLPADAKKEFTNTVDRESSYGSSPGTQASYAIQLSDADFEMKLSFESITRTYEAGTIGSVGDYTNTYAAAPSVSQWSLNSNFSTEDIAPRMRVFKHQTMPGVIEVIKVRHPKVRYRIYRDRGSEGGADDDLLLIPIDRDIAKGMATTKTTQLYQKSLHFIFNSHQVQETKWYQSSAFSLLLQIVAVVITVLTIGAGSGFAAALAAGATAVAIFVVQQIVIFAIKSVIFSALFKEVAKAIGVENAFWLAVAAMVVGAGKGIQAGKIVVNSTADLLLQAANGLVGGANAVMQDQFTSLMGDMEDFQTESSAQMKELEELSALLNAGIDIDPFAFIGSIPLDVAGETPDDYLLRTAHSGNVGMQSVKIVQNFVNLSLTLPTTNQSVGVI
jgi:hypothetical protein